MGKIIKKVSKELLLMLLILFTGAFILHFVYKLGLNDIFTDIQLQFFNIALFVSPVLYDSNGKNSMEINLEAIYSLIRGVIFVIFGSLIFYMLPLIPNSNFNFLNYFSFFMYIFIIFTMVKLIRGLNKDIKKGEWFKDIIL